MFKFGPKRKKKHANTEKLVDYTTYLPCEVWIKILGYLPVIDLFEVVLVSSFMNSMGSDPILWSTVKISQAKAGRELQKLGKLFWKNFGGLFDIRRFAFIVELDVSFVFSIPPEQYDGRRAFSFFSGYKKIHGSTIPQCNSTSKFKYLLTYDSIKNINLSGLNLSKVDDEVLAHGLSQFQKLNLSKATLTPQQVSSFIRASHTSTTLQTVNLKSIYGIFHVPAQVLSQLVHQLVKVDLSFTQLTTDQVSSLLLNVITSTRIKSVLLVGINMCDVEPELFSTAVNNLRHVALGGSTITTIITSDHINLLFSHCLETNTLKDVELDTFFLGDVEPNNMAKAIVQFERAILRSNGLNTFQLTTILSHCIESTSLKELCLDGNDLSKVDDALLAKAISYIPVVSLKGTDLTSLQLSAIFSHSARTNSRLRELSVNGADLQDVQPELLAEGVKNLVVVDLSYTDLRKKQIKALFNALVISNKIEFLNLEYVPKVNRMVNYHFLRVMVLNKKVDIKIKPNETLRNLFNKSIYSRHGCDHIPLTEFDLMTALY